MCCKPTLKFLIQISIIYKRQKDSLHLNFHLVACECILLIWQLCHDHENRFYHAILKRTVQLKNVHEHIEADFHYTYKEKIKDYTYKEKILVLIILHLLICNLIIFHMGMSLKKKEFYYVFIFSIFTLSNKLWWKQRRDIHANVL